jgi:hypothetical protein
MYAKIYILHQFFLEDCKFVLALPIMYVQPPHVCLLMLLGMCLLSEVEDAASVVSLKR